MHGLDKPGSLVHREIDLGLISGYHAFRVCSQPGQEHEHLLGRCVLRFVKNDKSVIQCPSPHICQWRYFNYPSIHVLLNLLRFQHIIQRIVERTQIREDLLLEVAWQKAQRLPCLDGRSRKDDLVDLFLSESVHAHRHRKICFPSSRRTEPENDVEGLNRLNIVQLLLALRNYRSSSGRSKYPVSSQLPKRLTTALCH